MAEVGLFDVPFSRIEDVPLNQTPWVDSQTSSSTTNANDKFVRVAETKHSKVRERKRYSVKLAKQLQSIGVNVDLESGIENKSNDGEDNCVETDGSREFSDANSIASTDLDVPRKGRNTPNKGIFESIADETLNALDDFSLGDDCMEKKEPGLRLKEPGLHLKEPGLQLKEPGLQLKEPGLQLKEPGLQLTEPGGLQLKEGYESMSEWDPMKASYEQKAFNTYEKHNEFGNYAEKHVPIQRPDGHKISPAKVSKEDIRLYISNIPMSLTEEGLINMFSTVGKCKDVKKCRIREGEETAFGFVTYNSVKAAEAAICTYNDFVFGGKYKLQVKLARNNTKSEEHIMWGKPTENTTSDDDRRHTGKEQFVQKETNESGRIMPSSNVDLTTTRKEGNQGDRFLFNDIRIKREGNQGNRFMSGNNNSPTSIARNEQFGYVNKVTNESGRKTEKVPSYVPMVKLADIEQPPVLSPSAVDSKHKPRLYVQGLPVSTTELEFKELFDEVAPCCYISIVPPKKVGQRTTFGFVSYNHIEDAEFAREKFQNYSFKSSILRVEYSTETKRNITGLPKDEDESFYDDLYADYSPPATSPRTPTNVIPAMIPMEEKAINIIPAMVPTEKKVMNVTPAIVPAEEKAMDVISDVPPIHEKGNEYGPGPSLRCESSRKKLNKGIERWLLLSKLAEEGLRLKSTE